MSTDDPRTEADAIIEIATQATTPSHIRLEPGGYYLTRDADGTIRQIDLTGEKWTGTPRRIRQTVQLHDIDSFINYLAKHADEFTEVWARPDRIEAIIDAHAPHRDGDSADWQVHRAALALERSDELNDWAAGSGRAMSQETLAEFIDAHAAEIIAPATADLRELAAGLEVNVGATYQSGIRLSNGARRVSFVETVDGRVREGNVDIPDTITIAVPILTTDTTVTELTARFRYRANPAKGTVTFMYLLDGAGEAVQAAFEHTMTRLAAALDGHDQIPTVPIFRGDPPASQTPQ